MLPNKTYRQICWDYKNDSELNGTHYSLLSQETCEYIAILKKIIQIEFLRAKKRRFLWAARVVRHLEIVQYFLR